MRALSILAFFICCVLHIQAQDTIQENVRVSGDTVFQKRTVEKVVYVYAAPENYTSIGMAVQFGKPRFSGPDPNIARTFTFGAYAYAEHQKNKWLYRIGIGGQSYHRVLDFQTTESNIVQQTLPKTDTISWYDVTVNNASERRYITRSYTKDTVYMEETITKHSQKQTYQYVIVPISVGRELRHGYLCADIAASIIPGILISNSQNNICYTSKDQIIPEQVLLRKITCDASLQFRLRYLLTLSTFISLAAEYNYGLVPIHYSAYPSPTRSQNLSMSLGFSYLLFEK